MSISVFASTFESEFSESSFSIGTDNWSRTNSTDALYGTFSVQNIGLEVTLDMVGVFEQLKKFPRFSWVYNLNIGQRIISLNNTNTFIVQSNIFENDGTVNNTQIVTDSNLFWGFGSEIRYKTIFAKDMSYSFSLGFGTYFTDPINISGDISNDVRTDKSDYTSSLISLPSGFIESKFQFEYYPYAISFGAKYMSGNATLAPTIYLSKNF